MGRWVAVARAGAVPPGTMRAVHVGRTEVLLANVGGTLYALAGWCTHRQASLADGSLWGEVVTCPFHGGQFDVRTGAVLAGPPPCPAQTYPVRVADGAVQIELPG